MGTYIYKAIHKKDLVCCHPTQIFNVGRKVLFSVNVRGWVNMHVVFFCKIVVVGCRLLFSSSSFFFFFWGGGGGGWGETLNFYGWPYYTYLSLQLHFTLHLHFSFSRHSFI